VTKKYVAQKEKETVKGGVNSIIVAEKRKRNKGRSTQEKKKN